MKADFEDDPITTWQNQPTETTPMSLVLIRQKARELQTRRWRRMLGTMAVPVIALFFYAFSVQQFPHLQQILHLSFIFALVWSLLGTYFLNREKSSRELPPDAGINTGLEFCRLEIERQLSYFHNALLWSLGPMLLCIGTFVLALAKAASLFPKGAPFLLLVAVWIITYLSFGVQQRRGLERELAELTEIAEGNS